MPKLTELWDKILNWGLTRENILTLVLLCQMGLMCYGIVIAVPWAVNQHRAAIDASNSHWQETVDRNTEVLREAIKSHREDQQRSNELLRSVIEKHLQQREPKLGNERGELDHAGSDVDLSDLLSGARPVGAL